MLTCNTLVTNPILCLIIPTYNRANALLELLDCLNENARCLEGTSIFINSSSDDGTDEYVKKRISGFRKNLSIKFISTPKRSLSVAIKESLLSAPGDYKAVIADDYIIYPNYIPKIISELRELRPLFYRSYFVGYHFHDQASCRIYKKPESILFAAQHLGFIYSAEAVEMLIESDALCFRSEHNESKELAWIHRVHWVSAIIAELLFLAMEKYPRRFVYSGSKLVGFSSRNYASEQGKVSTYPYWHAAFFSEETWSVVTLICKLSEKYPSNYNHRLRSRLINAYVFDFILKTFQFYNSSGLYANISIISRAKKLLKIFKYL
jgi:glycosyltransferase involved in cell wall biosynthesis